MSFTPFPASPPPITITDLTEKLAPVGADEIQISDSEDSNSSKKIQLANLPTGGSPLPVFSAAIAYPALFTNNGYVDVAPLSISFTVTGGRPVKIQIIADTVQNESVGTGSRLIVNGNTDWRVMRDATPVGRIRVGSSASFSSPTSLVWIDENPPAGTYTYKLQVDAFGSAGGVITYSKLAVMEL